MLLDIVKEEEETYLEEDVEWCWRNYSISTHQVEQCWIMRGYFFV